MASKRGDAKTQVEQWAKLFDPYLNKDMTLSFASKFNFAGVIIDRIEIAKTTGMLNKPKARNDGNKDYTPPVMQIITSAGLLKFVVEDTTVVAITNGIRLITAANEVDLRLTNGNASK
jgi:hypothetical protein